jgi:hypothetical protein
LRGYTFEKNNVFKEYVNELYKLKENSEKGSINYIIAKLLLNSLYGRFGMNPYKEKHFIIKESQYNNIHKNKNIIPSIINFNNGKLLISYISPHSKNSDK